MTLTVYSADDIPQGSDAWLQARCGILTASVIGQLITAKTVKPAANDTARGLIASLIAERITGRVDPVQPSRAMLRGSLLEDEGRREYAKVTGFDVAEVGFARLDTGTYTLGASPDLLVGDDGGGEIKSPSQKVHVQTVMSGVVPAYNRAQVQANLAVTGRSWWDFISYLPGEPLCVIRDFPDPAWQAVIRQVAETFEETAVAAVAKYQRETHGKPRTLFWDPLEEGEEIR